MLGIQWWIYIQRFPVHAPPPTGPNSFIFTYVFTEKCLCRRLVPPPVRVGTPPQREILDPPLVSETHTLRNSNIPRPKCREMQVAEYTGLAPLNVTGRNQNCAVYLRMPLMPRFFLYMFWCFFLIKTLCQLEVG